VFDANYRKKLQIIYIIVSIIKLLVFSIGAEKSSKPSIMNPLLKWG